MQGGAYDAAAGDTVVIYNGVYYENVTIWNSSISFEGESRNGVRIIQNASNIRTVQVRGNNVALRNLTLQGGYDGVDTVNLNSHNGTVDNVSIIGPSYAGLDMSGGSNWIVKNVNITGAGSYGVLMTGQAYNHTLYNVSVIGVTNYDGFQFNGVHNARADRLYVSNAGRMGIYFYFGEDNRVSNYTINRSNSYGIEFYYGHRNQLTDGLINNSNQDGVYGYFTDDVVFKNVTLTNHTRANTVNLHLFRSLRWTGDGFFVNSTLQALDLSYNDVDSFSYYAHTFSNASWNGVPIVFVTNQVGGGYTGPAAQLFVVNATGVSINITTTITGLNYGAVFVNVHNSTLLALNSTGNTLSNLLVRGSWDNEFGNFTQATTASTGWGGLYVHSSGWNRFVSNRWVNPAQSFTASAFTGGASNNSVEGLYCEGWNRCVELDSGSPDNAYRDSTFNNSYYCIYVFYGERFLVERGTFVSCQFGFYLYFAGPGVVDNSSIQVSVHSGIYTYYSAGPRVVSTVISNSGYYGIYSTNTNYGWIENSIIENATRYDYGLVHLSVSRYWTFRSVAFNNGTNPIDMNWANGMPVANAQHDIGLTNTYDGGPIVYFTNASGSSYSGPATWFGAVNSTLLNVSLQSSIRGPYVGAFLLATNNSTVSGLNASDCYYNFMVLQSFDNSITNFTQTGVRAGYGGLYLWGSHGNTFRDSVWANATLTRYAAYITGDSANNVFLNLTVTGWQIGIYGYFGTGSNRIDWSTLNGNYIAVELYQAAALVVANSTVRFNTYIGFYFYFSSGSRVENTTLSDNVYYQVHGNNAHYVTIVDSRLENQTSADRALLYLVTSRYWTLRGTSFSSSNFPIDLNLGQGSPTANAIHDIDLSNSVGGRPLVYFTNSTGGSYSGPVGFFGAANSTGLNVTLTNGISGLYHGGWAIGLNNSTVSGLNTSGGYINFMLISSQDNTFVNYSQTWVRQATYAGFVFFDSDRNKIKDSVLVNQTGAYTAIEIRGSSSENVLWNVTVAGWNTGLTSYFATGANRVDWSTFTGNYYGIYLYQAAPLVIANTSVLSGTYTGVYIYYSSGSRIENSTLAGSAYYQVLGSNAHYVTIQDSRLQNQTAADRPLLYLANSRYWTLRGNAFNSSNFPIDVNMAYNLALANAQHDIDTTNTVDGRPIVYFTNATGASYNGPVGFFGAVNSTMLNVTFTNSITGLYHGGWALQMDNSTVRGLSANGGYVNFYLARSNDNTFVNYTQTWVRQATYGGFLIWDSDGNTIRDSVLANATQAFTAIEIRGTSAGNVFNNTTVTGWNYGLYTNFASGPNRIERSSFTANYFAVYVYQSAPLTLANSTVTGSSHSGLYLYYASGSRVENSTLAGAFYYQVYANNAHYVTILDSRIENQTNPNYGLLYLSNSRYWTLRNVAFSNAYLPFDVGWSFTMPVQNAMHDIDTSNTYGGAPIVWFSNSSGGSYTGPAAFFVAVNSTLLDVTFTGQTVPTYYAAQLYNTDNSTIRGLNVSYATYSVIATASNTNRFVNLSFSAAPVGSYGALTFYGSHNNLVDRGAWANSTSTNTAAYLMAGSSYNRIFNVSCDRFYICVELQSAGSWNTIQNSTLHGTGHGIYANLASYIQILNNTIVADSYSIYFEANVANSFVFHNNLYQSSGGLRDRGTSNVWDAGYPAGGNFWSNGSHTDLYGGASQSTGGPDGIVDTAQEMFGSTYDYYPLSEPWPPQIALLSPANNSFIQPGVTLYFSVSRFFDNINYSIDNGSQLNFSAPFTLNTSGWSQGQHWVRIFCTDATNLSLGAYFVFNVDSVAPTITAVTPSPGSFNDVGTPFNFSVSDPNLANNVTWDNGSGANPFSAPWSISTAGWAEGTWNITIVAWDLAGNRRQSTFLYRLDSSYPVITLSSPANNSVVGAGTVINLDVTDTFLAQVVWSNGGPFTALASPYDISMAGWSSGTYNVTVVATDAALHQTIRVYTFTLDAIPPQITLVSPSNNSAFTSGTTIDIEIVELNLNSVTYDIGFGVSTFSPPYNISTFAWTDGTYNIEVWADDTAGNTAYALFILYIDSAPPVVTPPNITGGGVVAPGTVITFNVSDPTLANVTYSNGSGDVPLTDPYGVDTSGWADGNYTIVVNATDAAGHTTTGTVNITIDGTPPLVSLLTPTNGSVISPGTPISVDISDPHLNWSTWDNGSGPVTFGGPTNISTDGWADGTYNITIVAEDTAGNQQQTIIQVIIDSGPPTITAPSFSSGDVITPGTVIDFDITDPTFAGAGWVTDFGSGTLTDPFGLDTTGWPEGTTNLSVWANDSAGNIAWYNVTVTIDDTPPVVSLNTPANGSIIPAGQTIDIQIVELNLASAFWDNGSGTNSFSAPFDISTAGWADGTYNVTVFAGDLAGHTAMATYVFTIDSTPPQITLNSPSDGSSINAGDVIDLDIVEAFLANATWDNGSGQVVFSSPFDINTTGWAGGTYVVRIVASDLASNYAWLNFTVTIDTAPPSVLLVSPANGSVVVAGTTIVFNITDTDLVSTSWDDGSGAQSFGTDFEVSTAGWSDGTYTITVNATDGASNTVSLWFVFVIDSTPPSVTLNSPSSGAFVPAGTAIDLSVSDAYLDTVVWDNGGGPATLASPYDISTTGWTDGSYLVSVRAQDLAGQVTWNNFTINIDSTAPTVGLTSPANGSYIQAGTTLDISITDANLGTATWNNGSGAVTFGSPFNISTTGWADGAFTVVVTATDLAGNVRVANFVFTLDSTAPVVTLNTPPAGAYVPSGTTLDLSISETNLASATWTNGSGPFTLASPFDISTSGWADGAYAMSVQAVDLAGHTTWNNFTINIDSTPPAVSLSSPSNGSYIRAGTTLDLSVSDSNLASATWNSGSGPNTLASPFDISTSGWADGSVTVTVTATDLAGNVLVRSYMFTIDSTLPTVTLNSPSPGSVVVAGTALDLVISDTNLAAAGWVNATTGGTLTAPFDISTTGWPDGLQSISVFADDLAGNRRWLNFTVTIDSTPPVITLWTPANDSFIRAGTPILINISDLTLVSATWNNVTSGDMPFVVNYTVPTDGWIDRHYNITVRAVDGAGSLTTRVFHFVLDSTPPQVALVSPANGSWFPAGTLIDFVVSDTNLLNVNVTGAFTPLVGSWDLDTTTWPDGDYNITINASDRAQNYKTVWYQYHVDSTPPVITPHDADGSAIWAGKSLDFDVNDAYLDIGEWRNATSTFQPFATNFSIPTDGWVDGLYLLTVRAVDKAGNSAQRSFNYTIDSTDPIISILSPASLDFVRSQDQILIGIVDSTTVSLYVSLGGINVTSLVVPGANGTWVLPLDGVAEGPVDLFVTATDRASNGAQLTRLFTVDNTAPLLPASLVQMFGNEDELFKLSAVVLDAFSPPDRLDFNWQVDDVSAFQAIITLTGNNATWNFTEPGTYNISLTVTDPAGNQNNTTYSIIIFDTTPPDVNNWNDYIQWPEDTEFQLSIQATDNSNQTLNFSWVATGTNITANTSNISWIFPTPGVYNITLIVTDPSGNAVAQYALFNITDITPPDVVIVGPAVVDLLQQANFTVNVTDNDPRYGYANWTYVWEFTNLTDTYPGGTNRTATFSTNAKQDVTVGVTVRDAAGNAIYKTQLLRINVPPLVVGGGPPPANVSEEWTWTVDTFDVENGGPANVTLIFGPNGMQLNGSTLSWTPGPGQTGPQNVTIELDDGTTTVQKTFTLYVSDPAAAAGNHAPYWVSVPLQDARVNFEYDYRFEARDDDPGQTLQYFLSFASEEGFRLDDTTRHLRWFPPWHPVGDEPFERNVSISIIAFDGFAYANQTFVIRFRNPPNQWPVHFGQASVPPLGLNETHRIQISRYWSDPDDPLSALNFVINGTFEDREAIAGKVDWYVDRTNPLDPYLVITATAIGEYSFKLVARDPSGGVSENNTITVTVGSQIAPPASEIPFWLIAVIVAGLGVGLVGVAVAVRRSRAASQAAQAATRTANTALETASKIPQAVVQPAEPLPAKGTKKDTYVIEAVFIIYDDGRLIYSKTDISQVKFEDPELVASMFSAVQSFIKDSFQQKGELDRLGFGENTIMIERAKKTFMAAVIFGQPTEDLRDGMKETLATIENAYAGIIEEWDGSTTSLDGIDQYVMPFLATTGHLTRKDVELALTEKGVKMVSQLEFFQGFVRLKCGVKNDTDSVITKTIVTIDFNEDVLRLHHVEPETYRRQGSEVELGVLNPQEKASVAYYFDPQICTESMIDGIARYRDSKGAVHSVNMKTRKAEVVCPIFFTKEHANTAMLKRLVEGELDQRDSKVYTVEALPDGMSYKDVFSLLKDVVLSHDVHLVRDFIREDPYQAEVWFYGETKVKGYKIVIRAAVHEESQKVEFFAASTQIPAITGLLAEFNHTLQNLTKTRHKGLLIVPEFDEEVKAAVEKKSLMPKMEDAELESGETEQ